MIKSKKIERQLMELTSEIRSLKTELLQHPEHKLD